MNDLAAENSANAILREAVTLALPFDPRVIGLKVHRDVVIRRLAEMFPLGPDTVFDLSEAASEKEESGRSRFLVSTACELA